MRRTPPTADQHDADSKRYRWRLARRTLGIAQVHELHKHIASARAIGRQLGINHGTVRQWLKLTPPDPATIAELSGTPTLRERPPQPHHNAAGVGGDCRLAGSQTGANGRGKPAWPVAGTPAQATAFYRKLVAAGMRYFIVAVRVYDYETLHMLGEQVVPEVASADTAWQAER